MNKTLQTGLLTGLFFLATSTGWAATSAAILKNSQISYRAEGGFTGVKSYGVLISCVDGKISVLKSIHDPRLRSKQPLRVTGTMDRDSYLNLWQGLKKQAVFGLKDGPPLKQDSLDEFTLSFEAKIGKQTNAFKVTACSRPEASRYFAVRNLLDHAVGMRSLWDKHSDLARK